MRYDNHYFFEIEHYLIGVSYPSNKEKLLFHAKKMKAPIRILSIIEQLSNIQYEGPFDVFYETSKL